MPAWLAHSFRRMSEVRWKQQNYIPQYQTFGASSLKKSLQLIIKYVLPAVKWDIDNPFGSECN